MRKDRPDQLSFDFAGGRERREAGLRQVEENRPDVLDVARREAEALAASRPDRSITADDVQRRLIELGYSPAELGPAAGAIFRGKRWMFTGRWRSSERVSNHSRANRVWMLRS